MRMVAIAALMTVLAAPVAWADEPVATAPVSTPQKTTQPQPAPPPPPLGGPRDTDDADGPPIVMGPCGPETVNAQGKPDDKAHGEISVGAGTNGYRQVSGSVCKPIGDSGAVAVSVSTGQYGEDGYRRR